MSLDSSESFSQADAKRELGRSFVRTSHEQTRNPDPTAVNAIGRIDRAGPLRIPNPKEIVGLLAANLKATSVYRDQGMTDREIFDILQNTT